MKLTAAGGGKGRRLADRERAGAAGSRWVAGPGPGPGPGGRFALLPSHSLSSPSGAIGLAPPQWLPFQQPSPNPGMCPTFPQQIRESRRTGRILWSLVLVVPGKAAFSRSLELALVAETNS